VPFIDQYNPAGKDASYDGTEFCGPALLAGIAKARGEAGGRSDAELINELAASAGTVVAEGTSALGMLNALQGWIGMQTSYNLNSDRAGLTTGLPAGPDVIALGDFYAVPGRINPNLHAGHFIAVTAAGNQWKLYKVTDSADRNVTLMTDSQLQNFIKSNPDGL